MIKTTRDPMATTETAAELADRINAHLRDGGAVQVTTYGKSTVYEEKHAGWFSVDSTGCLMVRRGRHKDCLSVGERIMVAIRFGRYV